MIAVALVISIILPIVLCVACCKRPTVHFLCRLMLLILFGALLAYVDRGEGQKPGGPSLLRPNRTLPSPNHSQNSCLSYLHCYPSRSANLNVFLSGIARLLLLCLSGHLPRCPFSRFARPGLCLSWNVHGRAGFHLVLKSDRLRNTLPFPLLTGLPLFLASVLASLQQSRIHPHLRRQCEDIYGSERARSDDFRHFGHGH